MEKIKQNPLISIIIPVYNCQKYVAEAINSILKQPCKDFEIIIVNDGSTDNSGEICKQFAELNNNVKYIQKENGGVSSARNLGIENADGSYIAFLDADDVWTKDFYDDKLHSKILSEKSDMFCFGYIMSDEKFKKGNMKKSIDHTNNRIGTFNLFPSYLYSSSICKIIKFDQTLKYTEDLFFLSTALCIAKKISTIDKYIFIYRYNPNSATHGSDTRTNPIMQTVSLYRNYILNWLLSNENFCPPGAIETCKTFTLIYSFEYFREAAKRNVKYNEIIKTLHMYVTEEELQNPDNVCIDEITKYTQQRYFSDPEKYVEELNKQSFKVKLVSIIKKFFKKTSLARWFYYKNEYRTDITGYIYKNI